MSAEQGQHSMTPYTLAWLPGQGRETVELFDWAARHHPDPRVRRICTYYAAILVADKTLVNDLLSDRTHDPDYSVREQVLDIRFKRFIGVLWQKHNS